MATTLHLGRRGVHRVTGSVRGVNWRPTRFADEAALNYYACSVCHVLRSKTIRLPCLHGLCGRCQAGCIIRDGGSVCPLDGEPFRKDECQEVQLTARNKRDLKAYCWNEPQGCDFIGPLAALLQHYEAECTFHAFPCQQCGEVIVADRLAAHYIGGCSNRSSNVTIPKFSRPGGPAITMHDVTAVQRGAAESVRCLHEADGIATLQRRINELVGLVRSLSAQQEKMEEDMEKLEGEKQAANLGTGNDKRG
nr:TNF receptor-associated factor 3-like [Dermacentor andersoni]